MTDPVANILAALDFNEELKKEVDERITMVAEEAAAKVASDVTRSYVSQYLHEHGRAIVEAAMVTYVDERLRSFEQSPSYVNRHDSEVKRIATQAVQEHHRSILRQLTGSYNI